MIRLALYLILYMIPGLIVGYIILQFSPYLSRSVLAVLNVVIVCGTLLSYKRKKLSQLTEDGTPPELPGWLQSNKTLFFLGGASVIATLVIFNVNKADLYIDNATGSPVSIKLAHVGDVNVDADQYRIVEVVRGNIEVTYNGKKRAFVMNKAGKWVWNIDTANTYIRTTVKYSNTTDLYKDGKKPEDEEVPDYKLVKDEFFNANVDFIFNVPQKLSVKKSSIGKNDLVKTVLYRLNDDDFKDVERSEAPASGEDLPDVEVKPSKKASKQ